ncbi:protein-L-isoaspartate O-methyltransferase family protein [Ponticaulis profundi]|uniref:Protein-L-isoaspartate O-methyltransferase n=1 Tax=Ponticaulis profundi TaxID=2665222 RepID=A0ABW1SF32_9PROT
MSESDPVDFEIARKKMVDCQIRPNDVTDKAVIDAFATIPREAFVPKAKQSVAYSELELPTVEGRAFWLSRDLSKLLQAMALKSSDLALVIGAGEGYTAALMNALVDTVIALEVDEDVSEASGELLSSLGYDRVAFVSGKLEDGYAAEGPYDAILVNGLVEYVPDAWLKQLKPGGRLGVVVGTPDAAHARIYTATEQAVSFRNAFECVPPALPEIKRERDFVF